jgi:probable F420-dependent oxidoreductase
LHAHPAPWLNEVSRTLLIPVLSITDAKLRRIGVPTEPATNNPVQLGAVFPTNEIGNDPVAIRDWAQAAESLGFATIITYDHVVGAVHEGREPSLTGPYTEHDAFHEPFVLFGFLAASTTTIQLQTGVLISPQRQTALIAKQATEVDLLSGGRLVLGLGTGWNYVEYEALGQEYSQRGRYLDEQVVVLRQLFREPVIDYTGNFHRIDRAGLLPLPVREIPIWFGGSSERALRRAARNGDGFLLAGAGRRTRELWEQLRGMLVEEQRSVDGFPVTAITDYALGPDAWVEERDTWEAVGAMQLAVSTMDTNARWRGGAMNGFTSPAEHIAALELYAATMGA